MNILAYFMAVLGLDAEDMNLSSRFSLLESSLSIQSWRIDAE